MGRIIFQGNKGHGAVLIGNYGGLADGDFITLGDQEYEFNDTEGDIVDGRVWVDRLAGTAADVIAALVAAIIANPPTSAEAGSAACTAYIDHKATQVARIEAAGRGRNGAVTFLATFADAGNKIDAVDDKLQGAEVGSEQKMQRGVYVVSAIDVVADNVEFPIGLDSPSQADFDVYTSAGVKKYATTEWTLLEDGDGKARVRGNFAGAIDPAQDDEIRWTAWE